MCYNVYATKQKGGYYGDNRARNKKMVNLIEKLINQKELFVSKSKTGSPRSSWYKSGWRFYVLYDMFLKRG